MEACSPAEMEVLVSQMATEEKSRRGRRSGDGGETRRGRRGGDDGEGGVESRSRGMPPGVIRPGKAGFPVKTRLLQGGEARVACFQMDSSDDPWKIAARVFFRGEKPVFPAGKGAAKVGLSVHACIIVSIYIVIRKKKVLMHTWIQTEFHHTIKMIVEDSLFYYKGGPKVWSLCPIFF